MMNTAVPSRRPRTLTCVWLWLLALQVLGAEARAEVTGVTFTRREAVGSTGYEKLEGKVHFSLDPVSPRNAVVADLGRARAEGRRLVEFSADIHVLRPSDATRANGVALVDVANRGSKVTLSAFGRAPAGVGDPSSAQDLGDGFLTGAGYTLVWIGWQFDAPRGVGRVSLDAPVARGLTTVVRTSFVTGGWQEAVTLTDVAGYTLLADTEATLSVRDGPYEAPIPVPRSLWTLEGHTVRMAAGFEPGRIYEVACRARDLPVAGVGLAAVRDAVAWLKGGAALPAPITHVIGFGASQSGRFLRTFLYEGFNTDERGRRVFDGLIIHIAGAARLSINERGARPNQNKAPSPAFPFADPALRDPLTGRTDGLLANRRARRNQPKIFYTNASSEYWNPDRVAALMHTTADGEKDIVLPPNVRLYHLAGTQHVPAAFPPAATAGQQPPNTVDYTWTLRALLVAMERWVRRDQLPPASTYPTLRDGTLVSARALPFPSIPGVRSPRTLPPPREGDRELPYLVPAVDADGNERAGVRMPEQAVPVATLTGWNFRHAATGGQHLLTGNVGSQISFAPHAAVRTPGDPRPALAERYQSKHAYLRLARQHCERMVADGLLLEADVAAVMARVDAQWTHVLGSQQ